MQRFLARLYAALVLGMFMSSAFHGAHAATPAPLPAENSDGYDLWLRYRPLPAATRAGLPASIATVGADSPTLAAARAELQRGIAGRSASRRTASRWPRRPRCRCAC
jgi:alpha-glucuronidase